MLASCQSTTKPMMQIADAYDGNGVVGMLGAFGGWMVVLLCSIHCIDNAANVTTVSGSEYGSVLHQQHLPLGQA